MECGKMPQSTDAAQMPADLAPRLDIDMDRVRLAGLGKTNAVQVRTIAQRYEYGCADERMVIGP
jgi:hypothetical protein